MIEPINAIAGSTFMRTNMGQLVIQSPDGEEIYRGKPDPDAIQEHFAEEHELIRYSIHNWLQREGCFGSGWAMVPINCRKLAPSVKPSRGLRV